MWWHTPLRGDDAGDVGLWLAGDVFLKGCFGLARERNWHTLTRVRGCASQTCS